MVHLHPEVLSACIAAMRLSTVVQTPRYQPEPGKSQTDSGKDFTFGSRYITKPLK